MEPRSNLTLTRRRQRRPDLQSTFDLPADLQSVISRVAAELHAKAEETGEKPPLTAHAAKVVRATDAALQELLQPSLTPEQQLHAISKITGAIKDTPKAQLAQTLTEEGSELFAWGRVLALEAVAPLLLECRVRYLHRALMTLMRTLVPTPDATTTSTVKGLYVSRVLQRNDPIALGAHALSHTSVTPVTAAALYFPTEAADGESGVAESRAATAQDDVLSFLNAVDGLTSTLMPMMPSIFTDTFFDVLPLLASSFQWVVMNATRHSRTQQQVSTMSGVRQEAGKESGDGTSGQPTPDPATTPSESGGTVFGEDLEHIRFCVRVVATYIHKYMDSLTAAMDVGTASLQDVARQLACILQPTVVMLSSSIFPKDVLNAVGLLVASILTVRTCDGWLLAAVCAALHDGVTQSAKAALSLLEPGTAADGGAPAVKREQASSATASLAELFARADVTLSVVCAADPKAAAQANSGTGAQALHDLFAAFTPNGCFALLKGILAHTSSPIRGDWLSLGVLLTPRADARRQELVVAFDLILPAAQQYCNMVQEPETRFMAIQTVDSVVRHVNAVLTAAAKAVAAPSPTTPDVTQRHLQSLCVSNPKLQHSLSFATQLIMALWDDGTQQMSGALYGTYNEILEINERVKHRHGTQANGTPAAAQDVSATGVDMAVALDQMLDVQAERRGKYHALLGLLAMMPLNGFLAVLQQHYRDHLAEASVSNAVAHFSRTLLAGASNHKIGNVAGDVFAQLARALGSVPSSSAAVGGAGVGTSETAAEVLRKGIVEPLARAITEQGYVAVSSNVSEAVNISHIAAHFVAPLVKQDATLLSALLAAVASPTSSDSSASHNRERVEQGVVEVLTRARGVGLDIVPHSAPGSPVLHVLQASMHSLNYDVRNAALCLCVLGTKKIQAAQPWQLRQVEEYLVLNMHLGGDSTARKSLLEMLKKWVRRLMESYASKGVAHGAGAAGAREGGKKSASKGTQSETSSPPPPSAAAELPTNASVVVLELGTPAYRAAIMCHCRRLAGIFAENIGVTTRAGQGLAVERCVTAMLGYAILVQGLRTLVKGGEAICWTDVCTSADGDQQGPLLHTCTVPSLLATLSDGWSQARESARDLLKCFCELAPAEVFAEAGKSSGSSSGDAVGLAEPAALAERAHDELLRAQTYRNAEGAVQRFVLYTTQTAQAQAQAQDSPHRELERLAQLLEAEQASVMRKCDEIGSMRGSRSYAFIQANPLHGSLSLCAELLRLMSVVEHQLPSAASSSPPTSANRPSDSEAKEQHSTLTSACSNLLRCCCAVLRTCSSLVGTETVTAGATASLGESEVVDCRGHVYDRSRPEAESVMRGVVNNTWLSMRVATSAIEQILRVRPVHTLPFDEVRTAAYGLLQALLLTKHNGVMRCVREALKALAATLVRSRQTQFYRLPAELLAYLLGPEGVTSGDMARMLRRSQGLPHAILAVLEAEDTAVPYCLFPTAMRQLLRVARGGDASFAEASAGHASAPGGAADDVRRSQRSNALNVMKFVFEDKVFADRVVAYIEEAFSLATEGFHDKSWYTRNSSLMLFSAVIHRFVGEHPSTGGAGVNTSLHDVAKRTPRGVAYAYAELTRGNGLLESVNNTGEEEAGVDGSGSGSTAAEVNVALFPVLQLLSMLSPDPPHLITKASHSESDDTTRMSAAVMQCASSPSLMVRSASAVALCCLVPIAALQRTIAQTRHRLSMQAFGPSAPLHTAPLSAALPTLGGLNACHGAVLQLLQFHAQYVGTLRHHYRQKRSSYATPAVAQTVCHAISEVLLSCPDTLVRVCAVCPTVAASLFALLADLAFYGPQHSLDQAHQQALRSLAVNSLLAYMTSGQGVLERGSVMEGASAMLVFVAAQHRAGGVGTWTAGEQQQVAHLLAKEAAALCIRHGEHNLISWIMTQLIFYCSDERPVLTEANAAAVLQVLLCDLDCDISQLALSSLAAVFCEGESVVSRMGCIAWGQLVTHVRFAAYSLSLLRTPSATAASVADAAPDAASQSSSPAMRQLFDALVHLLSPPTDNGDAAARGWFAWSNSNACSAAIDFIACHDVYATTTHCVSPAVARILAFCAEPEQPLESRLAVVKALRTAQPFLRSSVTAVANGAQCPASAVTLLLVLLRLLMDDTSDIREAASTICSHSVWGLRAAPRDQTSCLLAVVRLLRQLRAAGLLEDSIMAESVLSIANSAAPGVEEDDNAEDDDDEEDDGDVLFQKEAANMFAEETVLLCLYGHVLGANVSADVAEASRCFTVYNGMLA